jgi:hypothetical protein
MPVGQVVLLEWRKGRGEAHMQHTYAAFRLAPRETTWMGFQGQRPAHRCLKNRNKGFLFQQTNGPQVLLESIPQRC